MKNLSGKVIVITGASSGLGKGAALELAKQGAHLVLAARRDNLLEEVARDCCNASADCRAIAVPTDVTKLEEMDKLVVEALGRFGHIDIWINDAGIGALGRFHEIPLHDHYKVVDTVLNGVMAGSYFAVKQFRKQGFGNLINVAALLGKVPAPLYASYVAANHGVVGLGAALREELAMDKLDKVIHVCTLMPPATNTPFFEHCVNYTGKDPEKISPMCEPEKVIDKLVQLCTYPEAEVTVGAKGKAFKLAHQIAPGMTEAIATKQTKNAMEEQKPAKGFMPTPDPLGAGAKGQ